MGTIGQDEQALSAGIARYRGPTAILMNNDDYDICRRRECANEMIYLRDKGLAVVFLTEFAVW